MGEKHSHGVAAEIAEDNEQWPKRRRRLKSLVEAGEYEIDTDNIAEDMLERILRVFTSGENELALI